MKYIEDNKEHLLKEHVNKFLLVHEGEFVGSFDDYEVAAAEGVRIFGIEANFLVWHMVEKQPFNFVMGADF